MMQTTQLEHYTPVIPTTSLFLVEELVGDKLDGYVQRITGVSARISRLSDTSMPYKWLKFNRRVIPALRLFYDRKRNSEEPFGIPLTAELATKLEIPEIWIHNLVLHLVSNRWGNRYYTFKNKPITLGSEAEAFVHNFYRKRKITNWITKIPRRHLELTKVSALEPYDWQNPGFPRFLSTRTHGLVFKKKVRRLRGDRFVDEEIVQI